MPAEPEGRARRFPVEVLDGLNTGVILLDANLRILALNEAIERYFGLRREDWIGADCRQLVRERIRSIVEDPEGFSGAVLGSHVDDAGVDGLECHVLAGADREDRWLEHRSRPIRSGPWAGGRIESFDDITRRKAAEEKLVLALGEVEQLQERWQSETPYGRRAARNEDELVGRSPAFLDCLALVERAAPSEATVLILGETGTGKELIARALHKGSPRADAPLISVNCAALAEGLIESELFGHEKGSFTGALARMRGRFELASGGTLFLDEIGDLPLRLQGKLLRALQEGEIRRLGGAAPIPVDVRVIAATLHNLLAKVEAGEFRADLYYRISAFPIRVPPLRERVGDVPVLAEHLLRRHARRLGRQTDSISDRMLQQLIVYPWPGNVRELENIIERALITSSRTPLELARPLQAATAGDPVGPTTLLEAERSHILRTLERARWMIEGRDGAAKLLDVPPSTLRSRIKRLGIDRPG